MNALAKTESLLAKAILAICATGMAAITIIICLQVACRYFLNSSLSWAEELSLYIEVYVIFLAGSYALGTGQHVCMDLVVSKVPRGTAVIFNKLTAVACLGYAVAMTCYCWNFMLAETGQRMATLPGYKWMIYLAMVIGSALMIFYSIVLLIKKPVFPDKEDDAITKEDEV